MLWTKTAKAGRICEIDQAFFTKFLEELVGPTLRQAEFFVLSFEGFFHILSFLGLRTLNRASDNLSFLGQGQYIGPPTV